MSEIQTGPSQRNITELPGYARFKLSADQLPALLQSRVIDPANTSAENIKRAKQRFVLHDIRSSTSLLAGLRMFVDAGLVPATSATEELKRQIEEIKKMNDDITVSTRNLIDAYRTLAELVRKNGDKLAQTAQKTDPLTENYIQNTRNTAEVFPTLVESALFMNSIVRGDMVKGEKHLHALQRQRVSADTLGRVFGNELVTQGHVKVSGAEVDGVRALMAFNIIQELKRTGIKDVFLDIGPGAITIRTKSDHAMDKTRLFQPSTKTQGKELTGDGLYVIKQFYGSLLGYNIRFADNSDNRSAGPYETQFSIEQSTADTLPQNLEDRLDTNIGYDEFKKNYILVDSLKATQHDSVQGPVNFHAFVMHDMKNIPTLAISPFTTNKSNACNAQLAGLMQEFSNVQKEKNIVAELRLLDEMTKIEPGSTQGVFPIETELDYYRRNVIFHRLFPTMHTSARFLMEPNSNDYAQLMDTKVKVSDILSYEFPRLADGMRGRSPTLNGFESTILFNFLKNAKEHGLNRGSDQSQISFTLNKDGFTVENFSNTNIPDQDHLFQLGGKGEHGGTGIGMFTAAKLYAPLIGAEVVAKSELVKPGNLESKDASEWPKYKIQFTLKRK